MVLLLTRAWSHRRGQSKGRSGPGCWRTPGVCLELSLSVLLFFPSWPQKRAPRDSDLTRSHSLACLSPSKVTLMGLRPRPSGALISQSTRSRVHSRLHRGGQTVQAEGTITGVHVIVAPGACRRGQERLPSVEGNEAAEGERRGRALRSPAPSLPAVQMNALRSAQLTVVFPGSHVHLG